MTVIRVEPASAIAAGLAELIGPGIAAHLVGLADADAFTGLASPDDPGPDAVTEMRLRQGYMIVRTISDRLGPETAKAWLFGANTCLDDEAPIDVVRSSSDAEELDTVHAAAMMAISL